MTFLEKLFYLNLCLIYYPILLILKLFNYILDKLFGKSMKGFSYKDKQELK